MYHAFLHSVSRYFLTKETGRITDGKVATVGGDEKVKEPHRQYMQWVCLNEEDKSIDHQ